MKKAIGPKEAQTRKMREAAAGDNGLFDAEAMEGELKAVREKYLTGARERWAQLKAQRSTLDEQIASVESVIAKAEGRDISRTIRKSGNGTRTRMSQADKEAFEAKALAFVSKGKGISRGQLAEHLSLEPSKAATILRALKEAKKIEPKGEKKNTLWHAI